MENRSHALIAGLFTIALIALAVLLAIWLGRDKIQRVPYEIVTRSSVSGLNLQAAVRYKGIKVGNVTDISFDKQTSGQINLRIEVLPDTPVDTHTFATLAYQGVTGIAFVQLDEDNGSNQAAVALKSEDDHLPRIPLKPGTLQNFEQRGLAILTQTEELTRKLNRLLDDGHQQTLINSVDQIGKAAAAWQALPGQIEPSLKRIPGLLDQSQHTMQTVNQLAQDASTLTRQLTQFSGQLQSEQGPVARLNTTLDLINDNLLNDTVPRLQSLTGDARSSLRAITRSADQLKDHPQSILFGSPAAAPGPGEPGFSAPAPARKDAP